MEMMLDLETLGNGPFAAVVQIGAASFNEDGMFDSFLSQVSFESAARHGKMDAVTIRWWMGQSEEARTILTAGTDTLHEALTKLTNFYCLHGCKGVWGFGATFDNIIIRNAYSRTELKCPWHFRDDRCFRTLAALFPDDKWPERSVHTRHNARDDAERQALAAAPMLRRLRSWRLENTAKAAPPEVAA
jgi:hypothetical protein